MATRSQKKKRKTSSQKSFAAGFNAAAKLAHKGKLRAAKGGKK